jgi:hypothetical protein
MRQTFTLKKGEITFEGDRITISDNAKRQKWWTIFTSGMWIIYGSATILKYPKTGDEFMLWSGILIGSVQLLILILTLSRTVKSEIWLNEVKTIKVKQRLNNKFLDIKLTNNRHRQVIQFDDADEIENFIGNHF